MVQFSYTDRMENQSNAPHIDVKAFAKAHTHLAGQTPLSQFERLLQDCVGDVTGEVVWSIQGSMPPNVTGTPSAWLHLTATAHVPLTCQRCLGKVDLPLSVDRDFRFVADEATALAEDDDSQEDLLVLSRDFDVQALMEDELLMAMPIVPMHEACESEYVQTSNDLGAHVLEERPHPFAALAGFKIRKD
jgi:uncharacterized protein